MRNLKKILALVLALVMSLSLMAVASADDELNLGDVSEVYAESVDVLTGLKVFQGNKGSFLPKDNITRAEVAAIIYRIVTGDVNDTQKGIYADYNKFSDVTSDAWYAGYVNYCANAEYVKGVGYDANGKAMFKPQQNVTGYEALAMILRAIGYDKNNEFTGPSWQIQTAATARNRGILKNIAEGTLGTAATREAVAEILCQTILVPVADYSLAFGYRTADANGKDNPTLAYTTFKMEKIEGVVMANEYASLTASTPLPAGQTTLDERTLNVTSTLDDLGESRYVYVIPQTGSTRYDLVCSKVYEEDGKNKVYDNEGAAVSNVTTTAASNGLTINASTQHFINFDEIQEYTATWRLEYVLQVVMSQYDAYSMLATNGSTGTLKEVDKTTGQAKAAEVITYSAARDAYSGRETNWNKTIINNVQAGTNPNGFTYEYRKVINAGEKLTTTDIANIQAIFTSADRNTSTFVQGEVYAGTTSVGNTVITTNNGATVINSSADLSDRMNFDQFVISYLNGTDNKKQVTSCGLGQHLKVIDNDNNGIADYVLETIYTVAIIRTASDGNYTLDIANSDFTHLSGGDAINQVSNTTKVVNDGEGELAVGNVVIYAKIDGIARAQLAATETAKINTVNRAAKTATSVDGTEWKESDVHTHSPNLESGVSNLVGNTTYTLYFDLYGNLAAFTEGSNGEFVLITDGWFNNTVAGGEYAIRAYIDGSIQTQTVTTGANLFINNNLNNQVVTNVNSWGNLKKIAAINTGSSSRDDITTIVANLDNGILTPVDKIYRYSQSVAMLDLDNNAIPGSSSVTVNAHVYPTDYATGTAYTDNVAAANKTATQVTALSNTVYYYVYKNAVGNTVVRTHTGYTGLPTINANYIEDVYAVGTLASNATGRNNYYTASIVVIELNSSYTGTNLVDAERVFVPDFKEVSNNLGIENVTMIRENGSTATLPVDMSSSKLDWYDEAGNLTRNSRQPGLFYLTEKDGQPGTYLLERMSHAQIRGSNFLTGYINRSTATQVNDFASVDMLGVNDTIRAAAYPVAPNGLNANENRARITADSKFYTLSYNSGVATLTESTADVVLQQTPDANVYWDNNDTASDAYLNENLPANGGVQRNEVLIARSGSNIVYAISFNEYRNAGSPTTGVVSRDFAQTVWYNSLVSVDEIAPVTFYGVPVNTNGATTEATYAQAIASGKIVIDVTGTNVLSWTLAEVDTTTGLRTLKMRNTDASHVLEPDPNRDVTYVLTVNYYNNSTSSEYVLKQLAATRTAVLTSTDNTVATVNEATKRIHVVDNQMSINQFKSYFESTGVGGIEAAVWKFTNSAGTELTNLDGDMTNVVHFQVTIKAEDGTEITYYDDAARAYTLTVLDSDGNVAYTTSVLPGDSFVLNSSHGKENVQYFTISDAAGNFYGTNGEIATEQWTSDPNSDGEAKYNYVANSRVTIIVPSTLDDVTITQGYHAANVAGVTAINGAPVHDAVGGAGAEVLFLKAGETVTLMKNANEILLRGKYVLVDGTCFGTDWGSAASDPASRWVEIVDGAATITMPAGDLYYRDNYYGIFVDGTLKGHVYHNDSANVSSMVSGGYYRVVGETSTNPVASNTPVTCNDADIQLETYYKIDLTLTGTTAGQIEVTGGIDMGSNTYAVKAGEDLTITPKGGVTFYINGQAYSTEDNVTNAKDAYRISNAGTDLTLAIKNTP